MALLHGQGPIGAAGSTSDVYTTPFPHTPGARMRDASGNEYVFCDFTGTVYTGTPVAISSAYTAAKIGTTGKGPMGVACGGATSDNAGWVQIYGRCYVQLLAGISGTSTSDLVSLMGAATTLQVKFILPTTATSTGPEGLRTTAGTVSTASGYYVEGIFVASDASVGDTSALPGLIPDTSNTSSSNISDWTTHTGVDIAVFLNYPVIIHRNFGE